MLNKTTSVTGIIVLYNPDFFALKKLVDSINHQLDRVIFVDNSIDENVEDMVEEICSIYNELNFIYEKMRHNIGIARAQNQGIKIALEKNSTHVLLLDQDSVLPTNMVEILINEESKLIAAGKKVAAIGPSFLDIKTNQVTGAVFITPFYKKISKDKSEVEATDYLIASGTLIRSHVIDIVGGMDEDFYIDFVDIEWCERSRTYGYQCFVVPFLLMKHSIGNGNKHMFGKNVILHSDFRHYYVVRNMIHLILRKNIILRHKLYLLFRLPLFIFVHTIFSNDKYAKVKIFKNATIDAIKNRMGKRL
ncbi:glycosyltransferase family 2 protein [Escherichia coli]